MSFKEQAFQFKALPFGLSSVPWFFSMVARVSALINSQFKALHQFLDNWQGWVMSRKLCAEHRDLAQFLCQELGWLVNWEKSELIPQQLFAFLGIHYDLISIRVFPHLPATVELRFGTLTTKVHVLKDTQQVTRW